MRTIRRESTLTRLRLRLRRAKPGPEGPSSPFEGEGLRSAYLAASAARGRGNMECVWRSPAKPWRSGATTPLWIDHGRAATMGGRSKAASQPPHSIWARRSSAGFRVPNTGFRLFCSLKRAGPCPPLCGVRMRKASGTRVPEAFRIRRRSPTLPRKQYHRPLRLNFCVRDGNRCGPQRKDTATARPGRLARADSVMNREGFCRTCRNAPRAFSRSRESCD